MFINVCFSVFNRVGKCNSYMINRYINTMNKDNLTKQIGVRFYDSDLPKIKEVAKRERVNLSAYVRKVVSKHIEDEQ